MIYTLISSRPLQGVTVDLGANPARLGLPVGREAPSCPLNLMMLSRRVKFCHGWFVTSSS
eukprot:766871-Hanusia_phi.AAC.3